MKSLVPFCVLLALLIFVEAFFFGYIALSYSRRVSDVKVTEQFLVTNILVGVSNFLSTVYVAPVSDGTTGFDDSSASDVSDPVVNFVDDLVVWFSPVSGFRCRLKGCDFYEGDFSPFGLIVKISSGRVYCLKDGAYVILRPSAPSRPLRQRGALGAEGEEVESAPL